MSEEIATFSEGHHSFRVLGWGFDGIYRVMTEGRARFAWEAVSGGPDAELELGGPRGGGPSGGGTRVRMGATRSRMPSRGVTVRSVLWKAHVPFENRQDDDRVFAGLVDDSIAVEDDLADVVPPDLRNGST